MLTLKYDVRPDSTRPSIVSALPAGMKMRRGETERVRRKQGRFPLLKALKDVSVLAGKRGDLSLHQAGERACRVACGARA